jgi:hypothetical protein
MAQSHDFKKSQNRYHHVALKNASKNDIKFIKNGPEVTENSMLHGMGTCFARPVPLAGSQLVGGAAP